RRPRGRDGIRDPGGARGHGSASRANAGTRWTWIPCRPDPLAPGDHATGEPGDPIGPDLLDRPRLLVVAGARAPGSLLCAPPGDAPDRISVPVAAADPAWGPTRGARRGMAHSGAGSGDAGPAVRP